MIRLPLYVRYMNLYRFKTFRTSYFFPQLDDSRSFLYQLYTPYGLLSRIYWWLFRHVFLVRWLNKLSIVDTTFPYTKIMGLLPKGCVVSFNMGTPGDEQKISMLGVDSGGHRFFAKYSQKPRAIELSKNEIDILGDLDGTGLVPELYDYQIGEDFCFFRTSYVNGVNNSSLVLNDAIVDLAITISKTHLHQDNGDDRLMTGLSHGDYTPWNMLNHEGGIRLIDWEMAKDRALGYDLFTFLFQVRRLFATRKTQDEVIHENQAYLNKYFSSFGIRDWSPYLDSFMNERKELVR